MSTLKNTFFIPPPDIPTQAGPENIFYDFNDGARVLLPEGKWHVRLLDADSDNILFCCDADNGYAGPAGSYWGITPANSDICPSGQSASGECR